MARKLKHDHNRNTDGIDSWYFYIFYVILVGSFYLGVDLLPENVKILGSGWTTINILHGIISFIMLHWIKGSPDFDAQGGYNHLTFYEQLDAGIPWTRTKKFLMLAPTVLLILASVSTNYDTTHLMVNLPVWGVLIIAKLPELHRVRILGINSTVGIDDEKRR